MEVWKDIEGYEGDYQVSDLGRVKSLKHGKEKILKQVINRHGYYCVFLSKDCNVLNKRVHRLVWEAFNCKTDLQIDHKIEGNKLDNRLSNLQSVTNRKNTSKHYLSINKSSTYIGVCWHKNANKWESKIRVNGEKKHLGYFINEIDAANAYQNALQLL